MTNLVMPVSQTVLIGLTGANPHPTPFISAKEQVLRASIPRSNARIWSDQ
jgi:hypothetical protein